MHLRDKLWNNVLLRTIDAMRRNCWNFDSPLNDTHTNSIICKTNKQKSITISVITGYHPLLIYHLSHSDWKSFWGNSNAESLGSFLAATAQKHRYVEEAVVGTYKKLFNFQFETTKKLFSFWLFFYSAFCGSSFR